MKTQKVKWFVWTDGNPLDESLLLYRQEGSDVQMTTISNNEGIKTINQGWLPSNVDSLKGTTPVSAMYVKVFWPNLYK